MNMPRFSAEASLYKTNQRYQLLASWAGVTREYVGLAQFLSLSESGPSCSPKVLCLSDSLADTDSPTGCFRFQLQSDCNIVPIVPLKPCPCPITCGPCVGFRQCSDGTQRSCSV